MSVDLDRQLQAYCRINDEEQGSLSFDDILERTGELQVIPGRGTNQPSPSRRWIAVTATAFAIILAVIGGSFLLATDSTPEPADQPTPTSVPQVWSGPVHRVAPEEVIELAVEETVREGRSLKWEDPLDSSVGWVDVKSVVFHDDFQPDWDIELAAKPPLARGLEPGELIAYGLVLDTNGDGFADYVVGIDNDAPQRGDFHVWVTDLATGETDEHIGPPYGYPIEFRHPDEQEGGTFGFGIEPDADPPTMAFTFIGGSEPTDLNGATVRWYAWTYATRGGDVFAWDYAPDHGWLTGPTR